MRWTERQQAMLQMMGLRLWQPGPPAVDEAALDAAATPGPVAAVGAVETAPAAPASGHRAVTVVTAAPVGAGAEVVSAAAAALRVEVQAMDWPALRDAVAGCRACTLCQGRRQTVFGVGHARAQLMVVGEAPGEQEDQRGEPFVGAAGQLLDQMLAALGLTRAESDGARQVYIANTLKCRPPHNRNPEPDELAACRPFLERQVELVRPRVILAMGRFAVQSLLQSSEPIGRLRGRVHRWRDHPLVVSYHPAYLLRNPADKARAWADLCLAAQLLGEPAARP